jgi:HK97 family phage portal protein
VSIFRPRGEQRRLPDQWFNVDPDLGIRNVEESATHLVPVFASIRHIVDFISTLPVDAYRGNGDGSRTEVPLPSLLRSQNATGRPGVGQWIGQIAYGMATRGNSVGWIVETDGFGFPSVVRWLGHKEWSYNEGTKQWYVGGQPVPASQLLHIPWIVPPGCTLGLAPLEHYASTIRAGLSAMDYADVRRGGGIPPAVLKNSESLLNPDQARDVRERASAAFASGKPFVTGSDWDLTITAIPPNHAQFIETMRLTSHQIAAIYGIDPREIGGDATDSLTYSTDESRSLNRANNMRPYIVRIEDALNRVMPERQFIKLNADSTVRTDIKTRFLIYEMELAMGTRSRNEVRALEDRQPIPDPEADKFNLAPPPPAPAEPTPKAPLLRDHRDGDSDERR